MSKIEKFEKTKQNQTDHCDASSCNDSLEVLAAQGFLDFLGNPCHPKKGKGKKNRKTDTLSVNIPFWL